MAFSTTSFHFRRSWTQVVQFLTLIWQTSCFTLSSHLYLGLPCDLLVRFHLNIFLTVLVSGILCTWPNQQLVHLVGFITRIYHDARSPERQTTLLIKILFLHDIWKRQFFFFSGRSVWHGFRMAQFDDVICGYKLCQSRIKFWRYRSSCLQCCQSDWICYIRLIPMNISFHRFHFYNLHYDGPDDKWGPRWHSG